MLATIALSNSGGIVDVILLISHCMALRRLRDTVRRIILENTTHKREIKLSLAILFAAPVLARRDLRTKVRT